MDDRWRKLDVWKLGDELAYRVYLVTKGFPAEERYGLTSQLRRAALSVPTNIVEGYSRKGDKELAHFVNIALGSLSEVRYLLHFAARVEYLNEESHEELGDLCGVLGKRLWCFYESVRKAK